MENFSEFFYNEVTSDDIASDVGASMENPPSARCGTAG